MKRTMLRLVAALVALGTFTAVAGAEDWKAGMKEGKPAFKSMGPLAFGPDGILFIADTKSAAITALDTGETGEATAQLAAASAAKPLKVEGINQKVAALIGSSADQVLIDD